jgi:hypothetical protein
LAAAAALGTERVAVVADTPVVVVVVAIPAVAAVALMPRLNS